MSPALIISILVLALVIYVGYKLSKFKPPSEFVSEKVENITDENFQSKIAKGVTLVDFWAAWCMPCKMMNPILNEVANNLPEGAKVTKLNIEQNQQVPNLYSVRSIPTMILFKDGEEVKRLVGVSKSDALINQIRKFI